MEVDKVIYLESQVSKRQWSTYRNASQIIRIKFTHLRRCSTISVKGSPRRWFQHCDYAPPSLPKGRELGAKTLIRSTGEVERERERERTRRELQRRRFSCGSITSLKILTGEHIPGHLFSGADGWEPRGFLIIKDSRGVVDTVRNSSRFVAGGVKQPPFPFGNAGELSFIVVDEPGYSMIFLKKKKRGQRALDGRNEVGFSCGPDCEWKEWEIESQRKKQRVRVRERKKVSLCHQLRFHLGFVPLLFAPQRSRVEAEQAR